VGNVLTCGEFLESALLPGTGTGTDVGDTLKLVGAAVQLGGEVTVEACGMVSGFGMAVPTDC
jgi:hypothetical protein